MSDEVPGLSEVARLLGRVEKRLDDAELLRRADQVELAKRLDDMERRSSERERGYVRADVYAAQQTTDAVLSRGLEAEMHSHGKRLEKLAVDTLATFEKLDERKRADRALVIAGLILPLVLLLLAAVFLPGGTP